jgi:chemotaxis protein methyltransferase CheR
MPVDRRSGKGGRGSTEAFVWNLSQREFELLRQLVYQTAGIFLSEAKKPLVVGRLSRRLRELGLPSFLHYYRHLTEVDPGEQVEMLNRISTNETRFFREPQQFDFLERSVLGEWADQASRGERPRSVRAWSAACATGEEPYSLAMLLRSRFPAGSGWDLDVLASDLSTRVLAAAEKGLWPVQKAADIPGPYLRSFMLRGHDSREGLMSVGPEIRDLVRFRRINLNDESYEVKGPFDLILCRNVLIYFDVTSRTRVIRRLLRLLAPDGCLLLGHAESLAGLSGLARIVGPGVYRRAT